MQAISKSFRFSPQQETFPPFPSHHLHTQKKNKNRKGVSANLTAHVVEENCGATLTTSMTDQEGGKRMSPFGQVGLGLKKKKLK